VATLSSTTSYRPIEFTSDGATPGPKELVEVDGGHFGIIEYPSAAFDRASEAQALWLARTLQVAS
jgi:hypothetical protein